MNEQKEERNNKLEEGEIKEVIKVIKVIKKESSIFLTHYTGRSFFKIQPEILERHTLWATHEQEKRNVTYLISGHVCWWLRRMGFHLFLKVCNTEGCSKSVGVTVNWTSWVVTFSFQTLIVQSTNDLRREESTSHS